MLGGRRVSLWWFPWQPPSLALFPPSNTSSCLCPFALIWISWLGGGGGYTARYEKFTLQHECEKGKTILLSANIHMKLIVRVLRVFCCSRNMNSFSFSRRINLDVSGVMLIRDDLKLVLKRAESRHNLLLREILDVVSLLFFLKFWGKREIEGNELMHVKIKACFVRDRQK